MPAKSVQAIAEDDNGNLWLGMEENFVYFDLQLDTFVVYDMYNTGLINQYPWMTDFDIDAIGIDGNGNVYFSQLMSCWIICNFNGSWSVIDDLYLGTIWGFACDQNGTLWMANDDGLCKFITPTTVHCYNTTNSNIPHNTVYDVVVDENNKIWIACGVVASFDGTSFTVAGSNNATYLGCQNDKIAVSTSLMVYNGVGWNTLQGNAIPVSPNKIEFESNGAVWVASGTLCAYVWNGIDWEIRNLANTNDGISVPICCMLRGQNGWLWFGGGSYSLSVFKGSTQTIGIAKNTVEEAIRVYPNPASEYIQIDISNATKGSWHFELYNSAGIKVVDIIDYMPKKKINTRNLQAGLFFIKLNDCDNNYTQKIIIH